MLYFDGGTFREFGPPQPGSYTQAECVICEWQIALAPTATIVLLDQPTIVKNPTGQRPVVNIVSSPVGLRYVVTAVCNMQFVLPKNLTRFHLPAERV